MVVIVEVVQTRRYRGIGFPVTQPGWVVRDRTVVLAELISEVLHAHHVYSNFALVVRKTPVCGGGVRVIINPVHCTRRR